VDRSIALLTPATGGAISRVLRAKRPPPQVGSEQLVDTLRGLDLNEGWIKPDKRDAE
jgi:hypothetical protein